MVLIALQLQKNYLPYIHKLGFGNPRNPPGSSVHMDNLEKFRLSLIVNITSEIRFRRVKVSLDHVVRTDRVSQLGPSSCMCPLISDDND